jgi:2-isopropylmalate synthase
VADKKKKVTALDLEAIVSDEMRQSSSAFELVAFDIEAGSDRTPFARATVRMPDESTGEGSFTGDGPVDAFFSALNAATGLEGRLKEYHVSAVTAGRDALAEVSVLLELDGALAQGQGVSPDTMEASGRAYLRALANAVGERQPSAEAVAAGP